MIRRFIRSIGSSYNKFKNTQYQQWKLQEYVLQMNSIQKPLIFLQFFAILIRLLIVVRNKELYIQLAINVGSHLILIILSRCNNKSKILFLRIIPLIQQVILNWFCIYFYILDESFLLVFTTFNLLYINLLTQVWQKLISLGICIAGYVIFAENIVSYELQFVFIISIGFHIIRQETMIMQFHDKLQALFLIIDSIPSAMCIVEKNKSQMLYSNRYFENLALTLEGTGSSETDQSPDRLLNYSKVQLHFLSNLQLSELNQQGISIVDFDDDLDELKIKKVDYKKDEDSPEFQPSRKLIYNLEEIEKQKCNTNFKINFFSSFKISDDETIQRKQYTTEISLSVELRHQPGNRRKKHYQNRKSSNKISINRPSTPTSAKLSYDQLINQKAVQNSGTLKHNLKFLVNVIENYKLFDEEDDLQIFFIHELNPILLRTSLKKLESVKKNIMRSISHELLTNLNAAYGYIKQCQDRLLKGESIEEYLSCAVKYTKLQLFKIQDFFDYRYTLDDKLVMRQDKFELITAITECVDLIKDQINRKQLSYQLEIPENVAFIIEGDRQRFCQVILNLLTNAIKFTYYGGITVQVNKKRYFGSCRAIDEVQSNISEEQENNLLEIHVKDSGVGMDEDELVKLRKKLHVADEDEKVSKQSVGIGLGLQVCKSIIRQLSPQNSKLLFVNSVKDSGTEFYFCIQYLEERSSIQRSQQFTIPFQDAQIAQVKVLNYNKKGRIIKHESISIELPTKKCKCQTVLIVDDEQFNIDIVSLIIKDMGFEIETALNGKQAVEKVKKKLELKCGGYCIGYHCILMDINMPIMSGWEAVQIIRQMECELQLTRTIPVIAITAFCSIADQEKSINEGFDRVIIKPATKEKLVATFDHLNL